MLCGFLDQSSWEQRWVWPTFDFASILTFRPTGPADDDLPRIKLMWSLGGTMDDQLISLTGENTYTRCSRVGTLEEAKLFRYQSPPPSWLRFCPYIECNYLRMCSAFKAALKSEKQASTVPRCKESEVALNGSCWRIRREPWIVTLFPLAGACEGSAPSFDVSNHPDRAEIVWLKP